MLTQASIHSTEQSPVTLVKHTRLLSHITLVVTAVYSFLSVEMKGNHVNIRGYWLLSARSCVLISIIQFLLIGISGLLIRALTVGYIAVCTLCCAYTCLTYIHSIHYSKTYTFALMDIPISGLAMMHWVSLSLGHKGSQSLE